LKNDDINPQLLKLGQLIKEKRVAKGLTLDELGEAIGYSNPYLSQIENGKRKKIPSKELLMKVAEELNIESMQILNLAGYVPDQFINDLCSGLMKELLNEFYIDIIPRDVSLLVYKKYPELFSTPCSTLEELDSVLRDESLPSYPKYNMIITLIAGIAEHKKSINRKLKEIPHFDLSLIYNYSAITYKGRKLNESDRKRILDMLKVLFPESEYDDQN